MNNSGKPYQQKSHYKDKKNSRRIIEGLLREKIIIFSTFKYIFRFLSCLHKWDDSFDDSYSLGHSLLLSGLASWPIRSENQKKALPFFFFSLHFSSYSLYSCNILMKPFFFFLHRSSFDLLWEPTLILCGSCS